MRRHIAVPGSRASKWPPGVSTAVAGSPPASHRGGDVGGGLLEGYDGVVDAVHAADRHVEREPADRVAHGVAPGHLVGTAAHQRLHRAAAEPLTGRGGQVEHAGHRHRGPDPHRAGVGARRPGREVPAGGVAEHDRVAGDVEPPQVGDAGAHVVEGGREAAAVADAAVVEVPHGPAAVGQVGGDRVLQGQVVGGLPEAAVQHHRGAHRAPAGR